MHHAINVNHKKHNCKNGFQAISRSKKKLSGTELWAEGGHIDIVSEYSGLEKMKKYIEKQGGDTKQLKLISFS